ncbi:MAG: DEAD/DEAH box helicase, partial [bacterium]
MRTPSATATAVPFTQATAAWFAGAFSAPTPAQAGAWASIAEGRDVLVVAPTGSGKTLAAFLWAIDRLTSTPVEGAEVGAPPPPLGATPRPATPR